MGRIGTWGFFFLAVKGYANSFSPQTQSKLGPNFCREKPKDASSAHRQVNRESQQVSSVDADTNPQSQRQPPLPRQAAQPNFETEVHQQMTRGSHRDIRVERHTSPQSNHLLVSNQVSQCKHEAGCAAYKDAQKQMNDKQKTIGTKTSGIISIQNELEKNRLEALEARKVEQDCLKEQEALTPLEQAARQKVSAFLCNGI